MEYLYNNYLLKKPYIFQTQWIHRLNTAAKIGWKFYYLKSNMYTWTLPGPGANSQLSLSRSTVSTVHMECLNLTQLTQPVSLQILRVGVQLEDCFASSQRRNEYILIRWCEMSTRWCSNKNYTSSTWPWNHYHPKNLQQVIWCTASAASCSANFCDICEPKNFASQKSWYQDSFMEREEEAVV
jgi:hypothetical protein